MKEIEDSIQHVEQKISETLIASGLEDAKSIIENFEVALQQHVESLTYQLAQLEDKQNATALELSDFQRVEDDGFKRTLEELSRRIDDLEHARESIGRIFHDSDSPRSERSRSPSQLSNWSGGPSREDDKENNFRAVNSNSRDLPPTKKRSKRKFAKVSGPTLGSPGAATFGGTPPRGPASMIERTGPPPFCCSFGRHLHSYHRREGHRTKQGYKGVLFQLVLSHITKERAIAYTIFFYSFFFSKTIYPQFITERQACDRHRSPANQNASGICL